MQELSKPMGLNAIAGTQEIYPETSSLFNATALDLYLQCCDCNCKVTLTIDTCQKFRGVIPFLLTFRFCCKFLKDVLRFHFLRYTFMRFDTIGDKVAHYQKKLSTN